STVLGIPCITLRENTERPITCWEGTNVIVGNSKVKILEEAFKIIEGKKTGGKIPEKWDGNAAERIVDHLLGVAEDTAG
ncbi:MAG: UDP-N-acetyl glucosamine 2-epimerase, partial [Deltaproteobacteria bacterium]